MPADETPPRISTNLPHILLDEATVDAILDVIGSLAQRSVPDVIGVGTTLVRDGEAFTAAATNELVKVVDGAQYEAGEGPCLQAIHDDEQIHVPDLSIETRWPSFVPSAQSENVRAILSQPLKARERSLGALNLYAAAANAFTDEHRRIVAELAEQASIVVANAQAYADATLTAENLREAMKTRELIGQAKGILMEREGCSADEAFDMLRKVSQDKNIKLRDVAQDIVRSAERGKR